MNDDDDLTVVGDEQWLADLRAQRRSESLAAPEVATEEPNDDDVTMVGDEQWLADLREQRRGSAVVGASQDEVVAPTAAVQIDDDITIVEGPEDYEIPEVSDPKIVDLPAPPQAVDLPPPVAGPQSRETLAPPPIENGGARWQPPSRLQAAEEHEPAVVLAGGQAKGASGLPLRVLALAAAACLALLIVAFVVLGGSDGADDGDEQPGVDTTLPAETSE